MNNGYSKLLLAEDFGVLSVWRCLQAHMDALKRREKTKAKPNAKKT